jgi:hypothetical protein
VTLGRLLVAWIAVAAWFEVATFATTHVVNRLAIPPAASVYTRPLVEALLLTLIASLWFDSLGSGGWWLLFLLIGALVTSPKVFAARPGLADMVFDLARYVIAGALLAWRLS